MSDYQYGQFIDRVSEDHYDPQEAENSIRRSILQSFSWMAIGLLVSGLTAAVVCLTDLKSLIYGSGVSIILLLIQMGLTIAFSASINSADINTLRAMFLGFCLSMGLTLSSVGLTYEFSAISVALFISAVYFGCLVIIGYTTKRDVSGFGTMLFAGLIALLIGSLLCFMLRVTNIFPLMVLGLLLFTGISVYDVQRLKKSLEAAQGMPARQEKMAIYFALQLYLDFVNIFLYVLRFVGKSSKD